jgi:hypothetical protein
MLAHNSGRMTGKPEITVENRRYHNFAPFVRQTGERKAQTCAIAILQQLRHRDAANAGCFLPVAVNLLKQMEGPTPTLATAGTTRINDGQSLFFVETYGGHVCG